MEKCLGLSQQLVLGTMGDSSTRQLHSCLGEGAWGAELLRDCRL